VKKIEAYLKPFRVAELRDALARARFGVIRVHEVEELRPADAYPEVVQGVVHQLDVTPRTLLVLLVDDDEVERAVALIQDVARTDHDHDGRIVITQVEQLVPVDPSEEARQKGEEPGPDGSVSL
jgi:nitrogen regulatory protein P-II 1